MWDSRNPDIGCAYLHHRRLACPFERCLRYRLHAREPADHRAPASALPPLLAKDLVTSKK